MSEHYDDGARFVEGSSFEGHAPACGCGRLFESKDERRRHISIERRKERQERIERALAWLDQHKAWGWLFAGLVVLLAVAGIWLVTGFLNLADLR